MAACGISSLWKLNLILTLSLHDQVLDEQFVKVLSADTFPITILHDRQLFTFTPPSQDCGTLKLVLAQKQGILNKLTVQFTSGLSISFISIRRLMNVCFNSADLSCIWWRVQKVHISPHKNSALSASLYRGSTCHIQHTHTRFSSKEGLSLSVRVTATLHQYKMISPNSFAQHILQPNLLEKKLLKALPGVKLFLSRLLKS